MAGAADDSVRSYWFPFQDFPRYLRVVAAHIAEPCGAVGRLFFSASMRPVPSDNTKSFRIQPDLDCVLRRAAHGEPVLAHRRRARLAHIFFLSRRRMTRRILAR